MSCNHLATDSNLPPWRGSRRRRHSHCLIDASSKGNARVEFWPQTDLIFVLKSVVEVSMDLELLVFGTLGVFKTISC